MENMDELIGYYSRKLMYAEEELNSALKYKKELEQSISEGWNSPASSLWLEKMQELSIELQKTKTDIDNIRSLFAHLSLAAREL